MAYVVLFSLTQTIDRFLKHDRYPVSENGKQKIESLREKVTYLQQFVGKYPEQANSLETRMRDAANEAEDIIEHFMYEHIRSHHKEVRMAEVGRAVKPRNDLYDFRDLRFVMDEINSIVGEATTIAEENVPVADAPAVRPMPNWSSMLSPVGIEEDLENITDFLCGESQKLEIIPITGMGGIGKTTLARNVYDHKLIRENFKVRVWVTVSQNYKTEYIFADLLDSLQKQVPVDLNIVRSSDSAEEKVRKILLLHKYVLVVDDLWSEKAWDDVKKYFPKSKNGSRIIITTRLINVAEHATSSTSDRHEMRFLSSENSWELLKQKVFQEEECPSELKSIGEDIATNCGGLPLAIVLIAGILSTVHQTPASWQEVGKNVRSALEKESGEFEERISLSYSYLPHHLRACFLYTGGFPEDHEIRISKLVKLWIAEGFVQQTREKSLEEGAEEFLKELLIRNLLLIRNMNYSGGIKSCSVHDLVRELCKRTSLDENYERRLSIADPELTRVAKAYGSTLRSVISFQPNQSSLSGLRKFRLLRLLDVVDTDAYSLPAPVFELFHLRYLSFGCPMELPAAVSRLQNLRTLIIRPSRRFRQHSNDGLYLPLEIWSLPLLTDLISFFDLLPNPKAVASALQTLSVVKKLICTEEMMKMIPNVKKLGITYFGDKYQEDYQLQNLVLLQQLENLKLVMKSDSVVRLSINLVFPTRLRNLTLSGWRLSWEYLSNLGTFPNLQVLKLRDHGCEGDTWETSEEQFPVLEFLYIDGSDLSNWETESSHFPKLKRLEIHACPSLTKIPDEIGEIATLEMIKVDRLNEDLLECVNRIREDQEDYGNTTFKVEC